MKESWDDYSHYGKIKNVPNHQPEGKAMKICGLLKCGWPENP